MSNIEKIRQEIERRKKGNMYDELPTTIGRYYEDRDLLAFIDSLPEEKSSEDLEEAAKANTDELWRLCSWQPDWDYLYESFIEGAEWMRKKDVEDMYMSDNRHFLKCYEQGKVDLKVEMMKDAVECEVADLNGEIYNNCIEKGMTDEDKVKIVIIKDND